LVKKTRKKEFVVASVSDYQTQVKLKEGEHYILQNNKPIIIGNGAKYVRKGKFSVNDRKKSFLKTKLGSSDSVKTMNEKSLLQKNISIPKHKTYFKLVNNVLIPVRPKRKKDFSPTID